MKTIITIGRSSDNDIVVDEKYETVSSHHAAITRDGDSYTFEDHSTNGSYINGEFVNNRAISINYGDEINLASVFLFDWDWIDELLIDDLQGEQFQAAPEEEEENVVEEEEIPQKTTPECIKKFNWGAFMLPFIWKCANGPDGLFWGFGGGLIVVLGRAFPKMFKQYKKTGEVDLVMIFLIWLIATRIAGILYGFWGNEDIWENSRKGMSAEEFDKVQEKWNKAGKVSAVFLIPLWIIGLVICFA